MGEIQFAIICAMFGVILGLLLPRGGSASKTRRGLGSMLRTGSSGGAPKVHRYSDEELAMKEQEDQKGRNAAL